MATMNDTDVINTLDYVSLLYQSLFHFHKSELLPSSQVNNKCIMLPRGY